MKIREYIEATIYKWEYINATIYKWEYINATIYKWEYINATIYEWEYINATICKWEYINATIFEYVQHTAFGVSFHLNLQSQSRGFLFKETWQKRTRKRVRRLRFEDEELLSKCIIFIYLDIYVSIYTCMYIHVYIYVYLCVCIYNIYMAL